jgi:uncharacterized protein (DUF2336 family)
VKVDYVKFSRLLFLCIRASSISIRYGSFDNRFEIQRGLVLVQYSNLVSDLEKALATRSAEASAILHQITELFLQHAGHHSAEQLDLYDEVLNELVVKVEVAARIKLAQQLALLDRAPAKTTRLLALDESIEVAEPVLSQSKALNDDTLTQCIAIRGQKHLHAIATRKKISEMVSGLLIAKGDGIVLGTLACNPGASISDPSFGMLVRKGADDDWLLECIAGRRDIPSHHLRELLSKASQIVRTRLAMAHPELRLIIDDIFPSRASTTCEPATPSIDYKTAEAEINSRELTEAVLNEFAAAKKLGEIIVSIARLSGLSVYEIEQLFLGRWTSPVAIILKAIGFQLRTVDAIYRARLSNPEVIDGDLIQTKAEFIAIRRPTAERIVRHFYAKRAIKISNLGVRHPSRVAATHLSAAEST